MENPNSTIDLNFNINKRYLKIKKYIKLLHFIQCNSIIIAIKVHFPLEMQKKVFAWEKTPISLKFYIYRVD